MKFNHLVVYGSMILFGIATGCERAAEPKAATSPPPASSTPIAEVLVPTLPRPDAPQTFKAPKEIMKSAVPPSGSLTEEQKIEKMLTTLAATDAVFVRNGEDYDGPKAADHLRMKWNKARGKVKTAEDFIEQLATNSSASGQPYEIRKKDGTTMPSGQWFKELLAGIEKGVD